MHEDLKYQALVSARTREEAIENIDPAHWHDVLLDGPKRAAQKVGD